MQLAAQAVDGNLVPLWEFAKELTWAEKRPKQAKATTLDSASKVFLDTTELVCVDSSVC